MSSLTRDVEELLSAWNEGDPEALGKVMQLACGELRTIARAHMRRERGFTLQPTALVNEVFLRFHGIRRVNWKSAKHFFGFAAQTMRRILVDHARSRRRLKRGEGIVPLSFDELILSDETPADLVALDQALQDLAKLAPRQARVVDLRHFVGLSVEETAAVLRVSNATVKRDWNHARLWLTREVTGS